MSETLAILAVGNCQTKGVADCIGAMLNRPVDYFHPARVKSEPDTFGKALCSADLVLAGNGGPASQIRGQIEGFDLSGVTMLTVPRLFFPGFHPDAIYPSTASAERPNPLGNCNSAILLAAWREQLSIDQTITLFRSEVYDALGYFDAYTDAAEMLAEEFDQVGIEAAEFIGSWRTQGSFMHQPLHPKLRVMKDVGKCLLARTDLLVRADFSAEIDDELAHNAIWPVYPEIARRLSIAGDYMFHPKNAGRSKNPDLVPMDLETFVTRSFAVFTAQPPELGSFARLTDDRLRNLGRFLPRRSAAESGGNPYRGLADFHWWSKSVAAPLPADVDPVVRAKFRIDQEDRIATAGSCFAQHIAKHLQASGYNYLVAEQAPEGLADPLAENFGVFSARFGNVYTTRQLVQLLGRAYGTFAPTIDHWELRDGGYVDPFRPRIASRPFLTVAALREARDVHFEAVRRMFETLDVFVFTLGLTEAWCSAADGAVVPLAPGTLNALVPEEAYVPHNFSVSEVTADLDAIVAAVERINPAARILLTVSPVPLIATFEDEHVLTATTYSKSVLRVAAGEAARQSGKVAYFPSYEIITGNFTRGRYYADDLREVREEGVRHVMRLFMAHYAQSGEQKSPFNPIMADMRAGMDIVCDEEEIGRSVQG